MKNILIIIFTLITIYNLNPIIKGGWGVPIIKRVTPKIPDIKINKTKLLTYSILKNNKENYQLHFKIIDSNNKTITFYIDRTHKFKRMILKYLIKITKKDRTIVDVKKYNISNNMYLPVDINKIPYIKDFFFNVKLINNNWYQTVKKNEENEQYYKIADLKYVFNKKIPLFSVSLIENYGNDPYKIKLLSSYNIKDDQPYKTIIKPNTKKKCDSISLPNGGGWGL